MNSNSTQLYRHFDAEGRLLYVGISINAIARLAQHKQASGWTADIAKVEVENFRSREDALDAERRAIEEEHPLHNRAGKVRRRHKPAAQTVLPNITVNWTRGALELAKALEADASM